MDLQQAAAASEETSAADLVRSPSLSVLPSQTNGANKTTVDVCREYVSVERHQEPSDDKLIQTVDSIPGYENRSPSLFCT